MAVQAQERVQRIQEFLVRLGVIQNNINDSILTPADSEKTLQKLAGLKAQYTSVLSENQRQKLDQVAQGIQQYTTEKAQKALIWLNERQQEYCVEKEPVVLWRSLEKAPPFLPANAKSQLNVLKAQVQKTIDENIVTVIEQQFLSISDIQQRQACLQRLEKILGEQ